jgi:mannose-P-dolichol utilization defect 1
MLFFLLLAMTSALTPMECIDKLQRYDLDKACLSLLLSKCLGYALVCASVMLKFPQIFKIVKNSSVEGISLTAFYIETLGFSIMAAYSIRNQQPISTYGEHASISIQCIIQVLCFWFIGKVSNTHKLLAGSFFIFGWVIPLFGQLIPELVWEYVPIYCTAMNMVVKISQIKANYVNGSTGNLSFITNFLNFLGTLSRIFTTLTELNNPILLFNYLTGAMMNGVIMLQFAMYWNTKKKEE